MIKKALSSFKDLTVFEWCLWLGSNAAILVSFALFPQDILTLIASLIGATALIFVAKGYVLGQVLTCVFALVYSVISFGQAYYGEMITYLFMTSPIAAAAAIEWLRHPYKRTRQVEVHKMTRKEIAVMCLWAAGVTAAFYFVLKAMGNASLLFSTLSITTSFVASYLTYKRSPYYGLGYASNDLVLIVLWVTSTLQDVSYLPMVVCFVCFFLNDTYGFFNWKRMQKYQKEH